MQSREQMIMRMLGKRKTLIHCGNFPAMERNGGVSKPSITLLYDHYLPLVDMHLKTYMPSYKDTCPIGFIMAILFTTASKCISLNVHQHIKGE